MSKCCLTLWTSATRLECWCSDLCRETWRWTCRTVFLRHLHQDQHVHYFCHIMREAWVSRFHLQWQKRWERADLALERVGTLEFEMGFYLYHDSWEIKEIKVFEVMVATSPSNETPCHSPPRDTGESYPRCHRVHSSRNICPDQSVRWRGHGEFHLSPSIQIATGRSCLKYGLHGD